MGECSVEDRLGLTELFEKAEKEGLWFHCHYQDMWFSPKELRQRQSEGKFMWGAVNWELRNPVEQLSYFERKIKAAQDEFDSFKARIDK